jgi:hypothetical protein
MNRMVRLAQLKVLEKEDEVSQHLGVSVRSEFIVEPCRTAEGATTRLDWCRARLTELDLQLQELTEVTDPLALSKFRTTLSDMGMEVPPLPEATPS